MVRLWRGIWNAAQVQKEDEKLKYNIMATGGASGYFNESHRIM
jgi:hypothetical protein